MSIAIVMRAVFVSLVVVVVVGVMVPVNVSAQNDGRATTMVFPQLADGVFADGSFYRSTYLFANPSSTIATTCNGALISNGLTTPLPPATWGPNAWVNSQSPGTGRFLSYYMTLNCTQPLNAFVLYSFYSSSGVKLGEATVFPSVIATITQILADQTGGAQLGIAIVNDSTAQQQVTIAVGDETGTLVKRVEVVIPTKSNLTKFLNDLIGVTTFQRGQVLIQCPNGCATIGLRYTGTVFSTIPSTVKAP